MYSASAPDLLGLWCIYACLGPAWTQWQMEPGELSSTCLLQSSFVDHDLASVWHQMIDMACSDWFFFVCFLCNMSEDLV